MTDTIVIGSGLAGLSAAIRLAQSGQDVTLLTFGIGGIQLGQGTIDVLGYSGDEPVEDPFDQMPAFVAEHPGHPYAVLGANQVKQAVDWLAGLLPGLLVPGDDRNHCVPTALGAMRPTYLVQPWFRWPDPTSVAVVGPRQIKDFYPELAAANLEETAHVRAAGYHIDLPARPGEAESSPVLYAKALENPEFLALFADLVAREIGDEEAVCLPAILGLGDPMGTRLTEILGRPVVETLLPPPSIPGMRMNGALTQAATAAGVRTILGSKVTGFHADQGRITGVVLAQAGRDETYEASDFVYAPGGFESGALTMDSYGKVAETLFGLWLDGADRDDLVTGDYWTDQKLFAVGVRTDTSMRPLDSEGRPAYENLHAAGGILAGAIRWTEKSGDGIAVASGVRAADAILGVAPDSTPVEPTVASDSGNDQSQPTHRTPTDAAAK